MLAAIHTEFRIAFLFKAIQISIEFLFTAPPESPQKPLSFPNSLAFLQIPRIFEKSGQERNLRKQPLSGSRLCTPSGSLHKKAALGMFLTQQRSWELLGLCSDLTWCSHPKLVGKRSSHQFLVLQPHLALRPPEPFGPETPKQSEESPRGIPLRLPCVLKLLRK